MEKPWEPGNLSRYDDPTGLMERVYHIEQRTPEHFYCFSADQELLFVTSLEGAEELVHGGKWNQEGTRWFRAMTKEELIEYVKKITMRIAR